MLLGLPVENLRHTRAYNVLLDVIRTEVRDGPRDELPNFQISSEARANALRASFLK